MGCESFDLLKYSLQLSLLGMSSFLLQPVIPKIDPKPGWIGPLLTVDSSWFIRYPSLIGLALDRIPAWNGARAASMKSKDEIDQKLILLGNEACQLSSLRFSEHVASAFWFPDFAHSCSEEKYERRQEEEASWSLRTLIDRFMKRISANDNDLLSTEIEVQDI